MPHATWHMCTSQVHPRCACAYPTTSFATHCTNRHILHMQIDTFYTWCRLGHVLPLQGMCCHYRACAAIRGHVLPLDSMCSCLCPSHLPCAPGCVSRHTLAGHSCVFELVCTFEALCAFTPQSVHTRGTRRESRRGHQWVEERVGPAGRETSCWPTRLPAHDCRIMCH